MAIVRILNKTGSGGLPPEVLSLSNASGDTISFGPGQTIDVDSSYDIGYDPIKMTVVSGGFGGGVSPPPTPPGGTTLPANVPPYSVLVTQGAGDEVTSAPLAPGHVLWRDPATGLIAGVNLDDKIAAGGRLEESAVLVSGSMRLITLSRDPNPVGIRIRINGISIDIVGAFSLAGTGNREIWATQKLNEAFEGTGTDGLGFDGNDIIVASYTPI